MAFILGLTCSASSALNKELNRSITIDDVRLDILCEQGPVELVLAKGSSDKEGSTPP